MATALSIGSIVAHDHDPSATLSSKGTVVSPPWVTPEGDRVNVIWHDSGVTSPSFVDVLVLYVDPLNTPGRSKGARETWAALKLVLNVEQPHAMEEMQRDLERARMEREDLCQRNIMAHELIGHTLSEMDEVTSVHPDRFELKATIAEDGLWELWGGAREGAG